MRTTIVLNPVKLLLDYLENIKIDELYKKNDKKALLQ